MKYPEKDKYQFVQPAHVSLCAYGGNGYSARDDVSGNTRRLIFAVLELEYLELPGRVFGEGKKEQKRDSKRMEKAVKAVFEDNSDYIRDGKRGMMIVKSRKPMRQNIGLVRQLNGLKVRVVEQLYYLLFIKGPPKIDILRTIHGKAGDQVTWTKLR